MKLVSIVGARPQFIKIAPLERSFERHRIRGGDPIEHLIVHTGQHYDAGMSAIFFDELHLPREAFNLGVGSASHGRQTGQMLDKIEQVLFEIRPDMVVIYGDTNSTVAGALAATKLHIPVAHVEAGVRSFNRRMPEEINRLVADHISDLLLAPTPTAMENLRNEGLADESVWTGDAMYDAVLFNRPLAETTSTILERLSLAPRSYGLVTVHRSENTDDEERLEKLLRAFNDIAARMLPLVFPMHPRTLKRLRSQCPGWSPHRRLHVIDPVGYLDMLCLVSRACVTFTDSGGLQKEAFFLGCPCITLREETEWVETIQGGGNILAGSDPDKLYKAVTAWQSHAGLGDATVAAAAMAAFGDGYAADRIRDALLAFCRQTRS